jgi:hypothetical protein
MTIFKPLKLKKKVENNLTGYKYWISSKNAIDYELVLIKEDGFVNSYNALEVNTVTSEQLTRFYHYVD